MELTIIAKEKEYLEIELKGEDYTFPFALCEILLKDKEVEFASVKTDHPELLLPHIIVRTKGKDPVSVLKKAAQQLAKEAKEFSGEIQEKMK